LRAAWNRHAGAHLGHIRLVHLLAVTEGVPARPSGVGQERCEPQHPAVDRDVVGLDTALGASLLDVAVGQAEAQVSADREHNHIGWDAEAAKVERTGIDPAGAVSGLIAGVSAPGPPHGRRNRAVPVSPRRRPGQQP
jgi:hypothetical protein